MFRQLLVGVAVSACNIAIHALVMTAVVRVAHAVAAKTTSRPTLLLIAVMVATVSVLMLAHVSEVIIWSLIYAIVEAAPHDADLFLFCIRQLHNLRLRRCHSSRATAWADDGNGVLLFGWSTAVVFEVQREGA
jgi:hypothetical protein